MTKRCSVLLALLVAYGGAGFGESLGIAQQSLAAQTPALDSLLVAAERHWPELAQRKAETRAATARAGEAARAFRPNVSVGGTYTLAAGGRAIALPVGDLLNPVYTSLNGLTQTAAFPQIDNVEEQFLPNNFYDARLRVSQPIIDPTLRLQRELAGAGVQAAAAATDVSRQVLTYRVRQAYFQAVQAREATAIYVVADSVLAEALRTTRSLIRNGAGLPLARERLLAERAQLTARAAAADARLANAEAQLAYLTGEERVLAARVSEPPNLPIDDAGIARAELEQLDAALRGKDAELAIEDRFRAPRLGAQLDVGSQDFDFGLQPYALVGLNLEVPLYDGGRVRERRARLRAEREATVAQRDGALRGFRLQAAVARNDFAAARTALDAYVPAVDAAERTLRDATRLYRAGSSSYLELLDARAQVTRVRLEESVARADTWLRYVAWLYAVAR